LCCKFEGLNNLLEWLIHRGAYFRNLTVVGKAMQFQGSNLHTSSVCSIILQTLTDDAMNLLKCRSASTCACAILLCARALFINLIDVQI